MHLVIDGYCSDVEKLRKDDHVRDFLDVFPGEIGMNKICRPSVVEYVGPKHEDWGISGFVLIAESHIAIHTYPEHRYINIDIFSCRAFDAERAIACVVQRFGLVKERSGVLNRGLDCLGSEDSTLAVDCTTCT